MVQQFIAPVRYVQGAGVFASADEYLGHLRGETAYLLGGETATAVAGDQLRASLASAGFEVAGVSDDVTACTEAAIDDYATRLQAAGADVVVGVGGGVALDCAQAAADRVDAEMAVVCAATIASTDAPCSTISVVYDEAGDFERVHQRERNPELVLVDTQVVAEAPVRFLRHGMGDAFATRFEAEAVEAAGAETAAGGESSGAALAIAREAHRRLEEYGEQALAAAERDAVTPALERIVETNTLLSGLGFESGGTAGAHGVQVGFTNTGVRRPHGVLVGFGTVAELVLQDRDPATIDAAVALYCRLGLDVTLDELDVDDEQVDDVARVALEHGVELEPVDPSVEEVAAAIRTADQLIAERR